MNTSNKDKQIKSTSDGSKEKDRPSTGKGTQGNQGNGNSGYPTNKQQ